MLTIDVDSLRERARELIEQAKQQHGGCIIFVPPNPCDCRTLVQGSLSDMIMLARHSSAAALGEGMELVSMPYDRTLEEVLDEGIQRLKQRPTWKLWTWAPETDEFFEAEAFRTFVVVSAWF